MIIDFNYLASRLLAKCDLLQLAYICILLLLGWFAKNGSRLPSFRTPKKTTLRTSIAYFLNLFYVQPRTAQFHGLGKRTFPASGKFQLSKGCNPPYKGWTLFSSGLCGCQNYIHPGSRTNGSTL